LNLNFAALDFIVTPSGELIFLELNANGQWGWIQELTHQPIAKSLAYLLAKNQL
jgi:D-alanine-D-alanine ligase-like ATP-grasp enzyme